VSFRPQTLESPPVRSPAIVQRFGILVAIVGSVALLSSPLAEAASPAGAAAPGLRTALAKGGLRYLGGGPVPGSPALETHFATDGTKGRIALRMQSVREASVAAAALRSNTAQRRDFAQSLRPLAGGRPIRIIRLHTWKRYLLLDLRWS
jgi:hypothetical protein